MILMVEMVKMVKMVKIVEMVKMAEMAETDNRTIEARDIINKIRKVSLQLSWAA